MNPDRRLIFWSFIAVFTAAVAWNILTLPGADTLKGNFKEQVFVRNEQNTGPIYRAYVVTLSDTLWSEMKEYGRFKPHTKYGVTEVYYFLDSDKWPDKLYEENGRFRFDPRFQSQCLASYKKDAMGQESFIRYR